jgi:hypothetical protein
MTLTAPFASQDVQASVPLDSNNSSSNPLPTFALKSFPHDWSPSKAKKLQNRTNFPKGFESGDLESSLANR